MAATQQNPCEGEDWSKVDIFTKRPRTPNDPYSHLSEEQLQNLKAKEQNSPFFHVARGDGPHTLIEIGKWPPRPGVGGQGRFWMDRYTKQFDPKLLRGPNPPQDMCYVAPAAHNYWPEERHNTCRERAYERWGQQKAGHKTLGHFQGEPVDSFTPIDLYRRHPSNIPGDITMKFGRPHRGYYMQRNPSETTWFGSSAKLNRTVILPDIQPKSAAEYQARQCAQEAPLRGRIDCDMWPTASEYTDKFFLHSATEQELKGLERARQHAALGQVAQKAEAAEKVRVCEEKAREVAAKAADEKFVIDPVPAN